ncbi:hypothetical protein PU629_17275 [Pullulanibacillus sp. KACC 23026]|uniref:hypothetical protein n=1 Tax=Pullulanibacillus sp. KACC 23026 TaxID=3028315 RepID=UPI0023AE84C8|nr:hypothetical protein [Pullulanibacillus sp. KACC 23026]WEG11866.1 hypothetical protein PU629_17275 [Pullulanibacillus sp. KACC 23026]
MGRSELNRECSLRLTTQMGNWERDSVSSLRSIKIGVTAFSYFGIPAPFSGR